MKQAWKLPLCNMLQKSLKLLQLNCKNKKADAQSSSEGCLRQLALVCDDVDLIDSIFVVVNSGFQTKGSSGAPTSPAAVWANRVAARARFPRVL